MYFSWCTHGKIMEMARKYTYENIIIESAKLFPINFTFYVIFSTKPNCSGWSFQATRPHNQPKSFFL